MTNNAWNSENPAQVARGGTGRATLTNRYILVGNNVNQVTLIGPNATPGIPFKSNGAGSNPGYGTVVVPGGGTGRNNMNMYCPVVGGTTDIAALQTVDPSIAQAGWVLTYVGVPGNPLVPVWAPLAPTGLCAFLAKGSNFPQFNVSGDGTIYTVQFSNEIFDLGSNFTPPYYFLPPVTGIYQMFLTIVYGSSPWTTYNRVVISTLKKGTLWDSPYYGINDATYGTVTHSINWNHLYTVTGNPLVDREAITIQAIGGPKNLHVNNPLFDFNLYFGGYLLRQMP